MLKFLIMNPKYCRYTPSMLRSLGYEYDFSLNRLLCIPDEAHALTQSEIFAYGGFKEIIKILFSDSRHPEFEALVTENSSPEVLSFVNNFLMKQINSVPASASDEDAFNMIIPRSVQTESELRPYLDNLKQFISESRKTVSNESSSTD